MENSTESSSDSDSNSSTSWVFVYDNSSPIQKAANTFHLDCSREPIQELTEQDLLSGGSDIESDTDGISVISESEVPNEDPCAGQSANINSDIEVVEENSPVSDESSNTTTETVVVTRQNERVANFDFKKFFKFYNIVGIGFILTAVVFASYNQILTKLSIKDAGNLQEKKDIVSYDEIDVVGDDTEKLYSGKQIDREFEQIVDMTISCAFNEKSRNDARDREIKRCVKKQYKSKRMACLKRNAGLTDEEALLWSEISNRVALESDFEDKDGTINDNIHSYKDTKYKQNKKKNKDKREALYNIDEINDIVTNKKKTSKMSKYEKSGSSHENVNDFRSKHKKKYEEKYKSGTKRESGKDKQRYKNQVPLKKPYKHSNHEKEYKEHKKEKHHKYNSYNKKPNKVFINIKNEDEKKYKDRSSNSNKNSSEFKQDEIYKRNSKEGFVVTPQKDENNSTSGEWYTNLHKARNQIRKQEHVSDWVFDRAYLRSKKRNKAQWYFKWMNVREQLRYKQSYRPYSS